MKRTNMQHKPVGVFTGKVCKSEVAGDRRLAGACAAVVAGLLAAPALAAEHFEWHGAGVSGGSTDSLWTTGANWQVDGTTQTNPPGAGDDARIAFNETVSNGPALEIDAGALGRDVWISGTHKGNGRWANVVSNATFGSLYVQQGSGSATGNNVFEVSEGATLTLTGGSAAIPTLRDAQADRTAIYGGGAIDLTGQDVYVNLAGGTSVGSLTFSNADSEATVDFSETALTFLGDTISFRSTQEITGLPRLYLNADLVSGDGNALDNFGGVNLQLSANAASSNVSAGTFASIVVQWDSGTGASGSLSYSMAGDQEIVGDTEGDGTGDAIRIERTNRGGQASTLHVDGYTLTVSSTAPVIIGASDTETTRSELNMNANSDEGRPNSIVSIAGDLRVNQNGVLIGDAGTSLTIKGDFDNSSDRNTSFNMTAATVKMGGDGTSENPQLFEVHGVDNGEAGTGANNFGIGHLVIGNSETWVQLVDEFDFSGDGADALYLGALTVHPGSTLDLNGLNVYVNGAQVMPGQGSQYGGGTIIPEPAALSLLGMAGLMMLRRRRA